MTELHPYQVAALYQISKENSGQALTRLFHLALMDAAIIHRTAYPTNTQITDELRTLCDLISREAAKGTFDEQRREFAQTLGRFQTDETFQENNR